MVQYGDEFCVLDDKSRSSAAVLPDFRGQEKVASRVELDITRNGRRSKVRHGRREVCVQVAILFKTDIRRKVTSLQSCNRQYGLAEEEDFGRPQHRPANQRFEMDPRLDEVGRGENGSGKSNEMKVNFEDEKSNPGFLEPNGPGSGG